MATVEALDLFCGAGGLSIGLAAAGASVVAGVEWDDDAVSTWANAHPGALAVRGNVNELDWRRFDGVGLVVGGPPCQPWSIGGLRRGEDDERDGWPGFIGALKALRPRAFLAENVAGLTEGAMRARAMAGGASGPSAPKPAPPLDLEGDAGQNTVPAPYFEGLPGYDPWAGRTAGQATPSPARLQGEDPQAHLDNLPEF
jgi:hypothetical protein